MCKHGGMMTRNAPAKAPLLLEVTTLESLLELAWRDG